MSPLHLKRCTSAPLRGAARRFARAVFAALIITSSVTLGASADEAYQEAKADYVKLKGDQKRRALRHHWQNVAKKFEAVAKKYSKSERAPEALFNSGELNNELSRFSAMDEDRDAAKRSYRRSYTTCQASSCWAPRLFLHLRSRYLPQSSPDSP